MRLVVWGAGAIGGTIGVYLHRGGYDVTLVDVEKAHVDQIRKAGLTLVGGVDVHEMVPAVSAGDVVDRFDVGLLCVKSQHTEEATKLLATHLSTDAFVVSLQNGFNPDVIAGIVGEERTMGGFINFFHADYLEPGVVRYGGNGWIVLGELNNRVTRRAEQLAAALKDFSAVVSDNIWGYLWAKEAYGAMLFATALSNETMADALANPTYQDLYINLGREVLAVAAAKGIRPEPFPGFDTNAFMPGSAFAAGHAALNAASAFIRPSPKSHSGVWRDLAIRKRRTEVDAQLGPIQRYATQLQVRVPVIARLVDLIHDVEDGRREQGFDLLNALRAVTP